MAVKQSFPPELHLTNITLVSPLPQVDVPHVGLQVLLLVEPRPADVALEGFVTRVNPPVIHQLKMSGKILPAELTSPGSLKTMNRTLVD